LQLQEFSLRNPAVDSSTTAAAFSSQLKSKVGNILAKDAALQITLNIDGRTYTF
jgi:hypothetical protein